MARIGLKSGLKSDTHIGASVLDEDELDAHLVWWSSDRPSMCCWLHHSGGIAASREGPVGCNQMQRFSQALF